MEKPTVGQLLGRGMCVCVERKSKERMVLCAMDAVVMQA